MPGPSDLHDPLDLLNPSPKLPCQSVRRFLRKILGEGHQQAEDAFLALQDPIRGLVLQSLALEAEYPSPKKLNLSNYCRVI